MSSTAFIPRSLRYGILSFKPANVPGALTPDDLSLYSPSHVSHKSQGPQRVAQAALCCPSQSCFYNSGSVLKILATLRLFSPFRCPVTALEYGSKRTFSSLNKSPFAGSYGPSNENAYSNSSGFISKQAWSRYLLSYMNQETESSHTVLVPVA